MSLSRSERLSLVGLLREISPPGLTVEIPQIAPDLAPLVGLPLPRRPRAILFDVYGTLLVSAAGGEPTEPGTQTTDAGVRAWILLEQELLKVGYRGSATTFSEALSRVMVAKRKQLMETSTFPEVEIDHLVEGLLSHPTAAQARRVAVLHEASQNPCAPMPGAVELLSRLRALHFQFGVVSNGQFYTPLLVDALFGEEWTQLGFQPSLSVFSYERGRAKPDPTIFAGPLERLVALGIAPGETLFVGNSSRNDVAPAKKLGLLTALFAGDVRSYRPPSPDSESDRPDTIVTSFAQLEPLVGLGNGLGTG